MPGARTTLKVYPSQFDNWDEHCRLSHVIVGFSTHCKATFWPATTDVVTWFKSGQVEAAILFVM